MITSKQVRAVAIIALSATLALSCLGWLVSGAHRGEYTSWLEAVSTALAFVAASIAAVYAAGALRREAERDRERDEAQERAQAELVSIWAESAGVVMAHNGSVTPLFDVVVGVYLEPHPSEPVTFKAEIMPPSSRPRKVGLTIPVLDAWEALHWRDYGWCVTFTDAYGIRWERAYNGRLINHGRVDDTPDPQPGG